MRDDLKTLYSTTSLQTAHMLHQILEEYNIPSSAPLTTGVDAPVEVLVPVEHWELASRIAAAFDKHVVANQEYAGAEDEQFYFWLEWPLCPNCKTPRQTKCQFCQTAGTDFSLADSPPIVAPPEGEELTAEDLEYDLMLLCHTCDEPFEPVFYRRCQWCQHEFSDGYEQKTDDFESQWTSRTVTVAVCLIVVGMLTIIYMSITY